MNVLLKLSIAALLGMAISLIEKNIGMGKKAADGNIVYPGMLGFIKNDWRAIAGGIISVLILFLFFGDALDSSKVVKPEDIFTFNLGVFTFTLHRHLVWDAFLVVAFGFMGYGGMAIPLRLFGVTNKLINKGIKDKTPEPEEEEPTPLPTTLK